MPTQTVMRFETERPEHSAAEWRSLIELSTGTPKSDAAWLGVRVVQAQTTLWLIAGTPMASDWLEKNLESVVRGVVDRLGRAARFEISRPQVRLTRSQYPVDYLVPKMIVAKSAPDWSLFCVDEMAPEAARRLEGKISRGIDRQLASWGITEITEPVEVALVDHGRPLPIMDGLPVERTGKAKPFAVLARAGLRFSCMWELRGEWQFGMLGALGFGRCYRHYANNALWTESMSRMLVADEEYAE